MSPDKEKELINIYPELFSDLNELNCFYLFSFECDDGWFDLLKDLISEIKSICENNHTITYIGSEDEPIQVKVCQVKEKYGTLRFYLSIYTDALHEVIDKAETRSAEICEICGNPGKIEAVRARWYKTVCEKCFPK